MVIFVSSILFSECTGTNFFRAEGSLENFLYYVAGFELSTSQSRAHSVNHLITTMVRIESCLVTGQLD